MSEERGHGDSKNPPDDIVISDIVNISNDLYNSEDEVVSTEDVLVWVDPLDATQEYTENLTKYVTTMVCVVIKGTGCTSISKYKNYSNSKIDGRAIIRTS